MQKIKTFGLHTWLQFSVAILGVIALSAFLLFHNYIVKLSVLQIWIVAGAWIIVLISVLLLITFQIQKKRKQIEALIEQKDAFYNRAVEQAKHLENGNYDIDESVLSENNPIINALYKVAISIKFKAKEEDENNWIINGIAEVSDLIRTNQELQKLSEVFSKYIIQKTNSIQVAFYVVNEYKGNEEKIDLIYCYAYNRKKYVANSFLFGEGLVGQAAIEADAVYRTEIPDNYMSISSGLLGDKKPKALFISPLIMDEKVYGVVELAAFDSYSIQIRKFLQEIGKILARAIFNLKVNERTLKMLSESQKMSEELTEQRQQLLENAKLMAVAQEELEKTNVQLEQKITEVNNAQKRQHALLERASEIISIYEPDGTIRYESPSIKNILGYEPSELQGKNERSKMHPEDVEKFDVNFAHTLKNPKSSTTFQFRYLKHDGSLVWIEATLTNLLNDPAINGIIMNSRDITMQKVAEREQRMRGQMQALSENSPDLITRLGLDKKIYYINPVIETLTQHPSSEFINKLIDETEFPVDLKNLFENIIGDIGESKTKFQSEIEIPLGKEKKIFQVKGIPEFNEQGNVETTLVVSSDITEQKNIEKEVKEINTKIMDSINYARRIQRAIIPNEEMLASILGNYMMYYKPKDVVSGDFPWLYVNGKYTYIAAVDCTGHGVPGAMMSLIGFLLLNDLANDPIPKSPADILNGLHKRLVATLKQNMPGSNSSDGMDLALCRINNTNNHLVFAGAHRPLYILKNNTLEEIKGDKFPIGGIQYEKKRVPFVDYDIQMEKGDSFFMFSDGLPDQTGGAEKKKFMTTRIQEIITKNASLDMQQIKAIFEKEMDDWMTGHKQVDDILLIGKRF